MRTVGLILVCGLAMGCGARKSPVEPVTTVEALRAMVPADLQFSPVPLDDKDNGYLTLIKATEALDTTRRRLDLTPFMKGQLNAIQVKQAKDILRTNAKAIDLFIKAVNQKRWRAKIDEGAQELFPELAHSKDLCRLLVIRSSVDLTTGNSSRAAADLMIAWQVGDRLIHCESSMIHYLVGVALTAIAERGMQTQAWKGGMSRSGIQVLLKRLPTTVDDAMSNQHRAEFNNYFLPELSKLQGPERSQFFKNSAMSDTLDKSIARALEGHSRPFDREATLKEAIAIYQELIKNTQRKWSDQVDLSARTDALSTGWPKSFLEGESQSEADIKSARDKMQSVENPFGKLILSVSIPLPTAQVERKRQFSLDVARISLANRLYAMNHGGANAPSLKALGLNLLDQFSGEPYRYDARRGVIYSAGPDSKDDGGRDPVGRFGMEAKDWVASIRGG